MDAIAHLSGYEITEQLYTGTRTLVYRAIRSSDKYPVIIKILSNPYPSFNELVGFRNQYTIAKNLDFPSIIKPLTLEAYHNSYALVMEDFGGVSLSTYLKAETDQNKPSHSLYLAEFLNLALQLADILYYLYQNRVIHKDIKPANILIHPETKQIKLIDFSISSLLPRETQEIHNANALEGTLAYLSPEQTGRMNRGIDYRSDFYAVGITSYQLLTGQLPFVSDDPMELVHCHLAKQPIPIHIIKPEIPLILSEIVSKLMAKNAENRYQSALGLKHDLEMCLVQLRQTGNIADFEIGKRDISDRFTIPEKLYGRETEVAQLLAAFERVAQGNTEMMLVAGFSGIGKTAVVNEVHKPIVRQRGYFIKGKFDQFNRNIPLLAFVQALRDLIGQLLCESDEQLVEWRTQILAALGENGQVLIEVIPELKQIIGSQPSVVELSGSAAQNRFNVLFQKFIAVFTTAEHPLVIFLDDLQWADLASLELIKLLVNDSGYLLVLGAYRDNEVSPAHPFIMTVAELKKTEAIVNTITLTPLTFDDTNHLVADTLSCSEELAQPLTELITRKTQGNPFFTTQFLKALQADGYISFNRSRRYWECDIVQVNLLSLTSDVVEFMALQLQKLPAATQEVLKLAACVGNQFDLATLAIVSEQSPTDAATVLWKALQEGLILPTSQIYKFFQGAEQSETEDSVNPTYRFLHDRVQQAAYSLIPDDQKQATHLLIARLLRQNTPDAELETNIFEIVNHWNTAISLVIDPAEKINLAELNLMAGSKAKASTAHEPALQYFQTGISLLSDGWQTQSKLMLALQEGAAEAAYLCGDIAQMEHGVSEIFAQKLNPIDRVKAYEIQIQAYTTMGRYPEAIAIARTALKAFNVHLPEQPTPADIAPALQEVAELLNGRTALELLDLPVMTAAEPLAAMQLLSSINGAAFSSAPLLYPLVVLTQVKLSVQQGNSALSAFSYSHYGSNILEDLDAAYEFGQLALQLVAEFNARTILAKVNLAVGGAILHCKSHLRGSLPLLVEGLQIGLEVGDLEFAGYSGQYISQCSYLIGKNLSTLVAETEPYLTTLLKFNQTTASNYIYSVLYPIQRLQGNYNQAELAASSEQLPIALTVANDLLGLHFYWVYQLTVSYLLNETPQVMEVANQARQTLIAGASLITVPTFYFYDSLTALAAYATASDQTELLDRVTENQAKLHHRAYHAPMNFQHKYDLVDAEKHRVLGNKSEAIELYDRAISGAKENEYIQEEALANELAAKFYLDWGKEKVASGYMQEAYYCYAKWGAKAKTDALEQRYPDLLRPILQQAAQTLNPLETLASLAAPDLSIHTSTQTSRSSSTNINTALDFAAILKASQSLSSTIQLDKLLHQLTQIILQNSGADRCALILPNAIGKWRVEAIAIPKTTELCSEPLDERVQLPVKLIQYVKNTQEVVAIDNLNTDLPVLSEYLTQQQPKSVLCLPILNQGNSIGILYLENRGTSGVFTSDRILILNFLCTQAAISLENARLYQQSQDYAQQLEQSQLQLVQSEKMSALGNLVAGVAHEINNPIGCIVGNVGAAQDYINDLLGIIDLYGKNFPQPGEEIEEELEAIDLDYVREDLPKLIKAMKDGGDRITSISKSLRTFSRADSDTKQKFNLHDGIDSTILILRHRLKANENRPAIEVITDYGQLPEINCFPGQLNQVFMNILANAIDALDESNTGRSFTEIQAHPNRIIIGTKVEGSQVKIAISDNGSGMPEEVKNQIFDHLFTTKNVGKGTGLGLAIARQIVVEKHGGTIEVDSVLGQSTMFSILLPIEP